MKSYLSSLNMTLMELLSEDRRVFLLGEDIADPYGGAFRVTAGLSTAFPDRVIQTPISEAGIVGVAAGMAMRGLRPVVEIMFGDFITLAADQIINHAAKFHEMYAGQVNVPIVIRTPMGGGRGYGPTHSQSLEKMLLGMPGLSVVAPSHFHDAGMLLRRAVLHSDAPVVFIEHKGLYGQDLFLENKADIKYELMGESLFTTTVLRNFDERREAPDIAILSYGGMSRLVQEVLESMADEEIWIVAIMPSLLSESPLTGIESLFSSCCAVFVIEEGAGKYGWGAEITASLSETLGVNCPRIVRISSQPTVVPAAREMEREMLPSMEEVKRSILEVLK